MSLTPGIQAGKAPPFYEMDEFAFQDLCRDLFSQEPDVATCDVYGKRGESQDGIDLLANRQRNGGVEVGQCKCYEKFPPAKIRTASHEFFRHWDRWSQEGVKRFILFVASDLSRKKQQEEILIQKKMFAEKGLIYEAWSAAQIRNKLRPYRGIVETYLGEYWGNKICGALATSPPSGGESQPIVNTALIQQIEEMLPLLSEGMGERLERMRAAWREGRQSEAIEWIKKIRSETTYRYLPKEVRAKLVRFEAGLELVLSNDTATAERLVEEASSLDHSEADLRSRGLIFYRKKMIGAALDLLSSVQEIDSLNLKAALLLEAGQLSEANSILEAIPEAGKGNPETLRLLALMYLAQKKVNQAQVKIRKALELEPRWTSIRWALGIILYFDSISPAMLPGQVVAWPEPVNWSFVKSDNLSLRQLTESAILFKDLLETMETSPEERIQLQTWRLACLSNNPESQAEAVDYCQSILQENKAHSSAIIWALARRYEIDFGKSQKALEKAVLDNRASMHDALALAGIYFAKRRLRKGLALLDGALPIFEKEQAKSLWVFWRVQAMTLYRRDALDFLQDFASDSSYEIRLARVTALRARAEKTGDWGPVLAQLAASYEETGESSFLLESCALAASKHDWLFVVDRAEELVNQVATSEAVRLAAISAFNAGRFNLCLKLLDEGVKFFKQEVFPSELRRLRVLSEQRLGALSQALAEAEALAQDEPATENLLNLAQAYLGVADLRGLSSVARNLKERSDLSPQNALTLARFVQWNDQGLARDLWSRAIAEKELAEDLVGPAVDLAFQMGLEREVGPLLSRMTELGAENRGGIKLATMEEIAKFVEEHRNQLQVVREAYSKGEIPIHILCKIANLPLVDFFHRLIEDNEATSNPRAQSVLLARHGGKTLADISEKPAWRLNLDVTALLLSQHLGILDQVEEVFAPLRVSEYLVRALLRMRDMSSFSQPSQIAAFEAILDLIEGGLLNIIAGDHYSDDHEIFKLVPKMGREWVDLLSAAKARGGFLVEVLPLSSGQNDSMPEVFPETVVESLVECRGIVEGLWSYGPLAEVEYSRILESLMKEGLGGSDYQIVKPGTSLVFAPGISEKLFRLGILRLTCEHFEVHIGEGESQQLRSRFRTVKRLRSVAEWLEALIERVGRGIVTKVYEVITIPTAGLADEEDLLADDFDLQCLRSLLQFESDPSDVLWIDDRYINAFNRCGVNQIIGISEVLSALFAAGALKPADYYEKITQMRAGNIWFVPLLADEIIYYLQQARVDKNKVVETRSLAILRRYVAACLLRRDVLQRPPMPQGSPNEMGEIAVLLTITRVAHDVLGKIWESDYGEEVIRARADWVFDNIYFEALSVVQLFPGLGEMKDERDLLAVGLAGFFPGALRLVSMKASDGRPLCHRYVEWIYQKLLRARFGANPGVSARLAESLKKSLSIEEGDLEVSRVVLARLLHQLYKDLPAELQEELRKDAKFMESIGMEVAPAVSLGDVHFGLIKFIETLSEAVNGRSARTAALESGAEFIFAPTEQSGVVSLSSSEVELRLQVGDELALLSESPQAQEEILRRNREWFDARSEDLEKVVAEVKAIEDPYRRWESIRNWQERSIPHFYAELREKLKRKKSLSFPELFPERIDALVRYLGLSLGVQAGDELDEEISSGARYFLREEGLEGAIKRYWCLPVPLPSPLIDAVSEADSSKRLLVKNLLRDSCSLLQRAHLVRILRACRDGSRVWERLALRLAATLVSDEGIKDCRSFFVLLRWVGAELSLLPELESWSSHLKLLVVWLHAGNLFSVFASLGIDIDWVAETFARTPSRFSPEVLIRKMDFELDVSHPTQFSVPRFIVGCIGYCCDWGGVAVQSESMRERLGRLVATEEGGLIFPTISMLKDVTLAFNSTSSFLGTDPGEALGSFLKQEVVSRIKSEELRKLLVEALREVESGQEASWLFVYAVLRELPPPENVVDQIRAIISGTRFGELFGRDEVIGSFAIQSASLQVAYIKEEEVKEYLKNELVQVARVIAKLDKLSPPHRVFTPSDREKFAMALISSALNIARSMEASPEAAGEFADLLGRMVEIWSAISQFISPMVTRLYYELPVVEAQKFGPLFVRLRAE